LCGIKLTDIDWVEQTIKIIGKGDKERFVHFGQAARQAIEAYLPHRAIIANTPALFTTIDGNAIYFKYREIRRSHSFRSIG